MQFTIKLPLKKEHNIQDITITKETIFFPSTLLFLKGWTKKKRRKWRGRAGEKKTSPSFSRGGRKRGEKKKEKKKKEEEEEEERDQSAVYKRDELLYTENPGKPRSPPRRRKERAAIYTVRGAGGRWLVRAGRRGGQRTLSLWSFVWRLQRESFFPPSWEAFSWVMCWWRLGLFFPLSLSPFRSSVDLLVLLCFFST